MGRGSQICWAINAKKFPSGDDKHARYTHIDLDGPLGDEIKRIRRKISNEELKADRERKK